MRPIKSVGKTVPASYSSIKWAAIIFAAMGACVSLNGWAQQASGEIPGIYDRIWAAPVLYESTDNSTVQSFSLIGRYHGQYWAVRADQGDADDWENRRMIFGFNSEWSQNVTLQAQMYVKTGDGSLYDGLYVAFLEWSSPDSDFSISAGRLDYLFTGLERSTSSKKITTIERGLLVNQLMPAEVVGAHLHGKHGKFSYQAGLFSRSIEEEFSDFDSGSAAVIGGAYDTPLFLEEGSLHLDYLYNSRSTEGNAFRPYRHVVSLWHQGKSGRLGMGMDLTVADPLETSGYVWGLTLEPTWMLTSELFGKDDPLQLALRYQYAYASEENGLHLQRRYEEKVTEGEGNRYQALYAGLNYYLYSHKFKLMAGAEYARMKDDADDGGAYRGWTWFGAVRLYF
jgi:phosphate-selective porin OprO/OprP